jgi:hypothetical protein
VHADQREVLVGAERVRVGLQQLGADQHRVEAADEEEHADADQVLHGHDLVVGREPEVADDALLDRLVLGQRGRMAEHAADRVVGEAQADQEADHAQEVAEHDRDVVLPRLGRVILQARAVDVAADRVIADRVPDDRQHDGGQQVEADQPPPHRPLPGGHRNRAHPPLLCGSGKYCRAYGSSSLVAGANVLCWRRIQVAKSACETTRPVLSNM